MIAARTYHALAAERGAGRPLSGPETVRILAAADQAHLDPRSFLIQAFAYWSPARSLAAFRRVVPPVGALYTTTTRQEIVQEQQRRSVLHLAPGTTGQLARFRAGLAETDHRIALLAPRLGIDAARHRSESTRLNSSHWLLSRMPSSA